MTATHATKAAGRAVAGLVLAVGLLGPARASDPPPAPRVTLGAAVAATLSRSPGVEIEKQVVTQREGAVQTARGQFDWLFFSGVDYDDKTLPVSAADQRAQVRARADNNALIDFLNALPGGGAFERSTGGVVDEVLDRRATFSAGVTKRFVNGVSVTPSATVVDFEQNPDYADPTSRSDVHVSVDVPLLRGLGGEAAGADYLAAQSERRAAGLRSVQNISQQVLGTVTAFWNCLAAENSYALARDSYERADRLLRQVARMVDAGLLEPAFLNQAQAKLFTNRADLTNGELGFRQRRQELALAMGIPPEEMIVPPRPDGELPAAPSADEAPALDPADQLARARAGRPDYLAAQINVETQEILFARARDDTRPRLDLSLRLGYAGIAEGSTGSRYQRSLENRLHGPNAFAGLTLELPLRNDAARGQVVSRRSLVRQAELAADQLLNRIATDVMLAVNAVASAREEYALARQSAEAYQKAVVFEKKKYDAGESSLNDLIDIEDRFISARLNVIEAVRKYAVARTQLLHATGTLLERDGGRLSFDPQRVVGAPL